MRVIAFVLMFAAVCHVAQPQDNKAVHLNSEGPTHAQRPAGVHLRAQSLRRSVSAATSSPTGNSNLIRTVAGTTWLFPAIGQQAVNAPFGFSEYGILDSGHNLVFSDTQNHMVFRILSNGAVQVVAGNGLEGFSGDGGQATQAELSEPGGLAFDGSGNLYIVDVGNEDIRRIDPSGNISTIAGTGFIGYYGDNGPAINADFDLGLESGIAADASGNVYVADYFNGRIRRITPGGTVTTIAGNGFVGYSGDNGPALQASFNPTGLIIDPAGNILVADTFNHRIRLINPLGIVSTIAGTGIPGLAPEGALAASATLNQPYGLFRAADGTIYFCDSNNNRVLHWAADGTLHTVAGGAQGYAGDGGLAVNAKLYLPHWVVQTPGGTLLIGDFDNSRVRAVSAAGIISTFAGNGQYEFTPNGAPASGAFFDFPWTVASDGAGDLLIADAGNNVIKEINSSGDISTIAGTGRLAFGHQEGEIATNMDLGGARDAAADSSGNIYVLDTENHRILKIGTNGIINTIAGTGFAGFSGDGGPAIDAQFSYPTGLAVDAYGNLFVADTSNNRIRKIAPSGIVSTVAGTGVPGLSGDGGPAITAQLDTPRGVAVDSAGNLYVADTFNHAIRLITPDGRISRFAGTGAGGFSGDGGPALSATFANPARVSLGPNGVVYIADGANNRVRIVTPDGNIATVAGNGVSDTSGDGGNALLGSINGPLGIAVGSSGTLYIGENAGNVIRSVGPGTINLQVAPASLNLSAQSNGAVTSPAFLSVTSSTSGLAFTVNTSTSSGGNWLKANPAAGLTPASISITGDPTGLAPGTYNGVVTIAAPPVVQTVAVTFAVAPVANPKLSVNANPLSFTFVAGDPPSNAQLTVSNTGTGVLSVSAGATTVSGGNWLSVSPATGTATPNLPFTLTVTANPTGLASGTYTGTVTVSGSNTSQSATIPVTMTITTPIPVLLVSQTGLAFRAVAGGGNPLSQPISVLNIGQGSMNWTAKASTLSGGNWLQLGTSSGTVARPFLDASPFEVTVNSSGLSAGSYYGSILVTAAGASNPQSISVVLTMLAAGTDPGPEVRPTGLVFTGEAGTSPSSQTFSIAQLGSNPTQFNSSRLTLDGAAWFVNAPTSGTVAPGQPVSVVVQPDFTELSPGVRFGQLSIAFGSNSGNFNSALVQVLSVVAPPGTLSPSLREPGPRDSTGCSPQTLNLQMTNNVQGISGVVGQAVPIEVKAVDNCGQPLTSTGGGVSVTFSTGDPQLLLKYIGSGSWSATWNPKSGATQSGTASISAFEILGNQKTIANQIQLPLTLSASGAAPFAFNGGVVNAASFVADSSVSPGEIITIFGSQLANGSSQPGSLPLPLNVNGTQTSIGGVQLPILYASSGQLNLQVPYNLAVNGSAQLLFQRGNTLSVPENLSIAPAKPAIFTLNQSGSGQGIIVNAQTNQLAASGNPVSVGTAVVIYCTGLGALNPPVVEGTDVGNAVPTLLTASVSIGGQNASVLYSGLTPHYPGLYQINAIVPSGVATGNQVPVTISIGGQVSPVVTMAIH